MLVLILIALFLIFFAIGDYQRKFGARNEVRKLRDDIRKRR